MEISTLNHPKSSNILSLLSKFKLGLRIIVLFLASIFVISPALAQVAGVINPTGGFNIDGTLKANTAFGDWVDGSGTGGFILDNSGIPLPNTKTYRTTDFYSPSSDLVFSGGKINDNPGTWTWKSSNATGKGDINNALLHLSEDNLNNQWLFVAGDRLTASGATTINFEFLQKELKRNTSNSGFTTAGTDGGRTQNDVLVEMEYGGGAVSTLKLYLWQNVGGWKYVEQTVPVGDIFGRSNIASTGVPFGAFGSATYSSAYQFSEAAVNITNLFLAIDPCLVVKVFTVMISTRTAPSIGSGLDDFVEPIEVRLDLGSSISYDSPSCPDEETVTVNKTGATTIPYPVGSSGFSSTPSGLYLDTNGDIKPSLSIPGDYMVSYSYTTASCPTPRISTSSFVINPFPAITAMTTSTCGGVPFTVTPVNGANGVVPAGTTYSWSAPTGTGFTDGAAGSGSSISGTLNNATGTEQYATYTVTPTSTCNEVPKSTFSVTVRVDAKPAITGPIAKAACSAQPFSVTPVNGINGTIPPGTTYSWAAPVVTGGLTGGAAGSASGSITGTLTNTSTTAQTATYTVTPVSGGCTGSSFPVVITVNPNSTLY